LLRKWALEADGIALFKTMWPCGIDNLATAVNGFPCRYYTQEEKGLLLKEKKYAKVFSISLLLFLFIGACLGSSLEIRLKTLNHFQFWVRQLYHPVASTSGDQSFEWEIMEVKEPGTRRF